MKSSLLRYLPPTLFLATIAAVSFFHYKTQSHWDIIDREKDQLAQEIRQTLTQLLAQKEECIKIIPMLEGRSTSVDLGEFSIPSTITYKGYFVDFLPFELFERRKDSLIIRYHFNVKERLQYSNWYLATIELAIEQINNKMTSCHLLNQSEKKELDSSAKH